ncbi:jg10724 [Pararge aegeria aegeria]|uniref:Jg10724 protein n=1 Tax=Pararge aegeria aegeria TaxID=348720 RepID=A0A8S4RIB2_9NEOP|nr:jg10724 [Pararge aegeria aegeria]
MRSSCRAVTLNSGRIVCDSKRQQTDKKAQWAAALTQCFHVESTILLATLAAFDASVSQSTSPSVTVTRQFRQDSSEDTKGTEKKIDTLYARCLPDS